MTTIIVTVIAGCDHRCPVRFVLPGKQNISTLATVILGVIVVAILIVDYERAVAGRTTNRV